jgi:hypothetical protein
MDISNTIQPKSDQLNADDLIGKTLTITVTDVKGSADPQQPVSIHYEGDNGKPYKPCKSMRRVIIAAWESNGKNYIGKRMTLYRDNSVSFGGIQVGGIRISHMSDINVPICIIPNRRQITKSVTVHPLATLPELTPKNEHWAAVMAALKDGSRTMEQIKGRFTITETNQQLLLS